MIFNIIFRGCSESTQSIFLGMYKTNNVFIRIRKSGPAKYIEFSGTRIERILRTLKAVSGIMYHPFSHTNVQTQACFKISFTVAKLVSKNPFVN